MESHVRAGCFFLFNLSQRKKMLMHNGTAVQINEEDTKENSRSLNTCKPICNNLQDHTAHLTRIRRITSASVGLTFWYSKIAHCCLKIAYDWNAKIHYNTPSAPAKLLMAPKPSHSTWFHPAMWGREQWRNRLSAFLTIEYDRMLLPFLHKLCRK